MALNFVASCFRGIVLRCGRIDTRVRMSGGGGRLAGKKTEEKDTLDGGGGEAVAAKSYSSKSKKDNIKVQKQRKYEQKGWKKKSRKRIKNPFKKSKAQNQKNDTAEDEQSIDTISISSATVSNSDLKRKLVETNNTIPKPVRSMKSTSTQRFPNLNDISNFQRRFLSIPAYNMGRTDDFRDVKSSHSETDTKTAVGLDLNKMVIDHKLKDEPQSEVPAYIPRFLVTPNDLREETIAAAQKIWRDDDKTNSQIDWEHFILDDITNLQLSEDDKGNYMQLGKGQFGTVYRGTYDERSVAVKFFDKAKVQLKSILEEATMLNLMRNSHVTPQMFGLVSVEKEEGEVEFSQWAIVMSYCGMNLDQVVLEEKGRHSRGEKTTYSPLDYTDLFYRISICVDAFHQKGIVMNDLKSNNIMIEDRNGIMVPTIIDLGLSFPEGLRNFAHPIPAEERDEFARQFPHCAPEVYNGGTTNRTSDMYSLGVMLTEICGDLDLYLIGEKGRRCSKVKQKKRPTAAQVANEYQDIIMDVMDRIDPVDYQ